MHTIDFVEIVKVFYFIINLYTCNNYTFEEVEKQSATAYWKVDAVNIRFEVRPKVIATDTSIVVDSTTLEIFPYAVIPFAAGQDSFLLHLNAFKIDKDTSKIEPAVQPMQH